MIELIGKYSIEDIIVMIVLLSLAIKGLISFYEWALERIKKIGNKIDQPKEIQENINAHSQQIMDLKASLTELSELVQLLIESDKDDIKAFITRQHHYFVYQKGYIDNYSLDCIEKRYSHYREEGGNSFVKDLMYEIRKLPKRPVDFEENKKKDQQ